MEYYQFYYPRNNNQTFFFMAIGIPASRAMSHFFFSLVSRNHSSTEDEMIVKFLEESSNEYSMFSASSPQGDYQIVYATLLPFPLSYQARPNANPSKPSTAS
jgi:hypothetical protein